MEIKQAGQIIEDEITAAGFSIKYAKSLRGKIYPQIKRCVIPHIVTRKGLYIACRQLGIVLVKGKSKLRELVYRAEEYAHKRLRGFGFSVPRMITKQTEILTGRKIKKHKKPKIGFYKRGN